MSASQHIIGHFGDGLSRQSTALVLTLTCGRRPTWTEEFTDRQT